jgi:metal-dependent amidase/aminoacylase/carboxypeptidase family protein
MPMATMTKEKRYALEWFDEHAGRFSEFHLRIWNYAEPAWREYKSAKAYRDLLRAEGFAVDEGSGEMPTAFCARWGRSGPVLGTYAEYDAVPGNSQQVVPYRAPRAGLHPWAAGHTDPHSALGTTSDGELVAYRELDDVLALTTSGGERFQRVSCDRISLPRNPQGRKIATNNFGIWEMSVYHAPGTRGLGERCRRG